MEKQIKILNKKVGAGQPCFIIAEAGINHNGSLKAAKKMIDVAKAAGADCIKFQTFKAKEFITDPNLKYTYFSKGKKVTESQLKMFERHEFSKSGWKEIIDYCQKKKIIFATTPQNPSDLNFILSLTDLPFIKIGSDDLTNLELIKQYAKRKKPLIISAGMAYEQEVKDAVLAAKAVGNNKIIVLHCVSSYPADPEEVNLNKIKTIREKFKVITGFSDHTKGIYASLGAVAFGAAVIEKHFTLDRKSAGPDHWFSADPEELKELVKAIRYVKKALGNNVISPTKKEIGMRKLCRRSIVAKNNIEKGKKILSSDIEYKRPGTGLAPKLTKLVVGKKAVKNIKKGEMIAFKSIK